jgi:hypothetical protein
MADKGQGNGTGFGYFFDKIENYMSLATGFTNVYNNCDLDYYMIAMSKATGNVSGAVNQVINTLWRTTDTSNYDALATALTAGDATAAAQSVGYFVKDFLMVEIPDKQESIYYTEVGQIF